MNISSNISSIQAHQTMMNTNANNVANVNTDRFVPNDTIIKDGLNDSVTTTTREMDDSGYEKSQTDIAKELTQQINIETATSANVTSIKTQDEMLGTLIDIKA